MDFERLLQFVPTFAMVFFRLAGMMLFAPLFGSSRIPRRVRVLLTLVLTMSVVGSVPSITLPETTWGIAAGIGGEMVFGLAMGMILSFIFIAAQWAGELIGQQMAFNLSEVFDPQFGGAGSIIGEMYFMLTLVIFLTLRGHHAMLRGVRASFDALPLLTTGLTPSLLDMILGLFHGSTILAVQLAAPMLVTMLVVDLSMGLIGKTMPQLNVMSAGMSIKSGVGIAVVVVGLVLTTRVLREAMTDAMDDVSTSWVTAGQ